MDRALLADRNPASHRTDLMSHYVVRCPDVVSIHVDGRPACSGDRTIEPDGRVHIDEKTALRIDGMTAPEAARSVADLLRVEPMRVTVNVTEYRSQHLYVFGEANGLEQAVAYRGPETVLDLLQRVGGITTGAAPRDVQVVRSHVADGKAPEVFQVDLADIVLGREQRTNITLQPYDKVYIGQTQRCKLSKCLPPWARSMFSRQPS
jgi:protein involved in polysaccharide export with SLBB domain